jgi:hypothetical protein
MQDISTSITIITNTYIKSIIIETGSYKNIIDLIF